MAILVFSGVLSVPSAVFAEASWYGSLRIGVQSSDSNLSVADGGSRWGIRGSHEAGEGLTAVYRFETKINGTNARSSGDDPGGRLAYVGLSGGFGSLTVGQVWSAAYNAAGAILDKAWYYGNAGTHFRLGNAVSYAFSNDLMALQVDVIYSDPHADGKDHNFKSDNPNDDLEKTDFGLTVNIGDLGKVALSHSDDKYTLTDADTSGARSDQDTEWGTKTTTLAAEVSVSSLAVYAGTKTMKSNCTGVVQSDGTTNACDETTTGQISSSAKTTFFGVSGGLGDTGVGYVFQWNDKKSSGTNPWVISLTKGLGDNASLVVEHADNDGSANSSQIGLVVNF